MVAGFQEKTKTIQTHPTVTAPC